MTSQVWARRGWSERERIPRVKPDRLGEGIGPRGGQRIHSRFAVQLRKFLHGPVDQSAGVCMSHRNPRFRVRCEKIRSHLERIQKVNQLLSVNAVWRVLVDVVRGIPSRNIREGMPATWGWRQCSPVEGPV